MTEPERPGPPEPAALPVTATGAYAERLVALEAAPWRRILNVQAPYRWNLRRLRPGFVLDVGCGLGRNLRHLDGRGVGIDHNPASLAVARERGLEVYTPEEFESSAHARPGRFDALLVAHVLEHLGAAEAEALLVEYGRYVVPGGKVIMICPQEAGYRSDASHVTFFDGDALAELAAVAGLTVESSSSFPFPRFVGRHFPYNEFVMVARTAS
jgi:SAM-dependent methyltransferase